MGEHRTCWQPPRPLYSHSLCALRDDAPIIFVYTLGHSLCSQYQRDVDQPFSIDMFIANCVLKDVPLSPLEKGPLVWSDTSTITPPIPFHRSAILLQTPTAPIPTNIATDVIRVAGKGGHQTTPAFTLYLTHNVVTEIALVEGRGRVGCAAYALQFGTLRAGGRAFAGESLAAADGFPGRLGGAGRPVSVGFDGVALARSEKRLVR